MQPSTIVILIVCILALASLLYGVLRKFSRMGWAAWQILFAWCITMTLDWLPEDASDGGRMAVGLAVFFGAVVGTLALGGAVRLAMLKRKTPAHPAWRFFDRVLGGILGFAEALLLIVFLLAVCSWIHVDVIDGYIASSYVVGPLYTGGWFTWLAGVPWRFLQDATESVSLLSQFVV